MEILWLIPIAIVVLILWSVIGEIVEGVRHRYHMREIDRQNRKRWTAKPSQ